MQKRRNTGGDKNTSAAVLPMTEADVVASRSGTTRRRVRKKRPRTRNAKLLRRYGPPTCAVAVVIVMIMLGTFVLQTFLTPREQTQPMAQQQQEQADEMVDDVDEPPKQLPLSHFSSLTYALENADLVALYFAASWCPMSTPVTEKLETSFSQESEILLPPKSDNHGGEKRPLAIVYVSSDNSEEEMAQYSKDKGWINVPFESGDRSEIKKHFRVCAKKELPILDIDRKFEIPTLLILDGKTHGVLTTDGVSDLESMGSGALNHWQDMQHLVRGLEDKYLA